MKLLYFFECALYIRNYLSMEYLETTVVLYPSRQNLFPSDFLKLPHQSPLLGNTEKYTHSRASPIWAFSVVGQRYWAIR